LKAGEPTVFYALSGCAGRVFAKVSFVGRPMGLVWAEKVAGQPWTETDRAYLHLTAQSMERSPAVAATIGPVLDPERLAQRIADASVIAGRVAHDFNNILTGIIGFADLALPLLAPQTQQASFVAEIRKTGNRGITVTQQLHSLNSSGQARPNPSAFAAALAKEESRLKPAMHPTLRIEKDFLPGLPLVAMESGALQSVVGHLLENAIEACPQGGLIRVSVRPVELGDAEARSFLGTVASGSHLQVTIADTGSGIKPEVRRRLFVDPFYTTKVRHRGLGLAVAFRTLSAHRGGLLLEPVPPPGTGTVARVVIPQAAVRSSAITPPPPGFRDEGRMAGGTLNATTVGG
jgi:signal transduction histidine kinase